MVSLEPNEVCPFGSFCGYSEDVDGQCNGLNPERKSFFICELWAENYEFEVKKT